MFAKKNKYFSEYGLRLFKKDDDCFEYFKERCRQKGVRIISVIAKAKGQGFFKDTPYMCIYVANEKDFIEYKADFDTRETLNNCTKEKILSLWYETCKTFNLNIDDYYHPQMYISLQRIDHYYYSYFAREYKQEITDIVTKEVACQPKYVFASSSGYISIVFTEEQYAIIEKYTDKIINGILDYTNTVKNNLLGDIEFSPLVVNIYHLGMKNISFYGLSRED